MGKIDFYYDKIIDLNDNFLLQLKFENKIENTKQ